MYVCMYVCMYTYIYIYIHTHTLRKCLFVGPTECPNRTLRTRAPSEARVFQSKWAMFYACAHV